MDKIALKNKIRELEGLSNNEKAALIELLNKQKKYGLVWEDKPEDVEERLRDELPVLKEVKERFISSEDPEAPNHILIEGDNLEALTVLSYTHAGKIDVIYIDPPYNTGNKDFVYNDSFVDSEDSFRHSKWLSFINKRLKIAKGLLSENGVIFISIDDNEQAQLKLLCDEIFGSEHYEATITYVRKTSGKQDSSNFVKSTEYIMVYSAQSKWNAATLLASDKVTDRYNKEDKDGRRYRETDLRKTGNADRRSDRPLMFYPFYYNPVLDKLTVKTETDISLKENGYVEILPIKPDGTDGRWRWAYTTSLEHLDSLIAKKMPKYKDKYTIYEKDYIDKKEEVRTIKEHTSWDRKEFNSDNAMADFKKLGFGNQDFPFPKSTDLIKHIIYLSNNKNATILDFFAGSGTTLQAALTQNQEDSGKRRCILVTNNENGICEKVTYERSKRVIKGFKNTNSEITEGLKSNALHYYKTDFISRDQSSKNMRALVAASTDLLCIKNDIYTEALFAGKQLSSKIARYFENRHTRMLVIYKEEAIFDIVNLLLDMQLDERGKIKVYTFASGRYAYDDDFMEVADKVELCALPAAIYDAYKHVLPKRKPQYLPEALLEEGQSADHAEQNVQGTFNFD